MKSKGNQLGAIHGSLVFIAYIQGETAILVRWMRAMYICTNVIDLWILRKAI
jgi:hypothetical protein